jgi:hypothetical protein
LPTFDCRIRVELAGCYLYQVTEHSLLGIYGIQVAFKQGAGVLEVLFGVGFGDAVKRFVQDADDSLLFGEGGRGNWNSRTAFMFARGIRAPVEVASICSTVASLKNQY